MDCMNALKWWVFAIFKFIFFQIEEPLRPHADPPQASLFEAMIRLLDSEEEEEEEEEKEEMEKEEEEKEKEEEKEDEEEEKEEEKEKEEEEEEKEDEKKEEEKRRLKFKKQFLLLSDSDRKGFPVLKTF